MKSLIPAIALMAVAAPALAQEAAPDPGGRLEAMTCREFIAFAPEAQMTMMLAMRAHANGDPLPDTPLPVGVEAEVGGADGLGGDSGDPGAAANAEAGATDGAAEGATSEDVAEAASAGTGTEEVTEVENTVAAAAGEPSPEALTEESLAETPTDPKLTAMRTSCLGAPDALASDALRAAHADYE